MALVVIVDSDSDRGHAAQTEGQSYGREAENGAARQHRQGTHWLVLPVRRMGFGRDVGAFNSGSLHPSHPLSTRTVQTPMANIFSGLSRRPAP